MSAEFENSLGFRPAWLEAASEADFIDLENIATDKLQYDPEIHSRTYLKAGRTHTIGFSWEAADGDIHDRALVVDLVKRGDSHMCRLDLGVDEVEEQLLITDGVPPMTVSLALFDIDKNAKLNTVERQTLDYMKALFAMHLGKTRVEDLDELLQQNHKSFLQELEIYLLAEIELSGEPELRQSYATATFEDWNIVISARHTTDPDEYEQVPYLTVAASSTEKDLGYTYDHFLGHKKTMTVVNLSRVDEEAELVAQDEDYDEATREELEDFLEIFEVPTSADVQALTARVALAELTDETFEGCEASDVDD